MIIAQTAMQRLPGSIFKHLWHAPKQGCEQNLAGCPVDALRRSLAREADLLRQKEVLIQEQELLREECDHRLLNGLQMVVSLLSLQSRAAVNPEVAAQLSVAASRVGAIERVHRRLHSYDGTKTVALKKYLEGFCHDFSGIGASDDNPEILVEGDEIEIPTATAIPLGFIVNELITNAVKYGKGRIIVGLKADPAKGYALSVSNDGSSLPQGFDPARSKGLGMTIIQALVKQIKGKLVFGPGKNNQGTRFVVLFS